MHADHSVVEIIGHILVASLFLIRGIGSIPRFGNHLKRMRARKVPLPELVLTMGFVIMLAGGAMVALDFYAWIGAVALLVFVAAANLLYHDFWAMDDPDKKLTHTYFFLNNIAVMGGLVLVVA